jgi:hypothetical protein
MLVFFFLFVLFHLFSVSVFNYIFPLFLFLLPFLFSSWFLSKFFGSCGLSLVFLNLLETKKLGCCCCDWKHKNSKAVGKEYFLLDYFDIFT